jgi:hypothetical protein
MLTNKNDGSCSRSKLVISACPADLKFCLSAIKENSHDSDLLLLVTWANKTIQEAIKLLLKKNKAIQLKFLSGLEAYYLAKDKTWISIYIFTMGADWLGRILLERQDILQYTDCYFEYDQLKLREINWNHFKIIGFHGFKYWLTMQLTRAWVFIKYRRYKLSLQPDMHIWPKLNDIKAVWKDFTPSSNFEYTELPKDSVIFCLSSIDNGWSPDWNALKKLSKNFYYKEHPRTGSADYLEYPDWISPLTGYDLPMEMYLCPDSTVLIGTTSTALGASSKSISLWKIKVLDWEKKIILKPKYDFFFKKASIQYLNCREDLQHLYDAYASRAGYVPNNNQELMTTIYSVRHNSSVCENK